MIDDEQLRRCVVRVQGDNGAVLGTGFFVAPRWILTCAHVVGERAGVSVKLDQSLGDRVVPASVETTSGRPAGHAGVLWPFPDLALLHLPERVDHPVALLSAAMPASGDDLHAWGFGSREQGVVPGGSPASFRLEGVEHDGYLKLKQGEAPPGLSGSPLVCPRRRAVIGVVVASRQRNSDLGIYAAPVAALIAARERIPGDSADLHAHGLLIRDKNPRAVISDGRTWHRVVPVEDHDRHLERKWRTFAPDVTSSPSDLLHPEYGIVPYLFRDDAIRQAVEWCDLPQRISIATVSGRGGAGKTRFAVEVCRILAERGWLTGFWRRGRSSPAVPVPRLVVVDYAEVAELHAAQEMLIELERTATALEPVRVMLLSRTTSEVTADDGVAQSANLATLFDSALDISAVERPLGDEERKRLYREALDAFDARWPSPGTNGVPASQRMFPPDLSADRYSVPLEVLFEALDGALRQQQPEPASRSSPVDRVLEHERTYWTNTGAGLDLGLQETAAALATLAGAADESQTVAVLGTIPRLAAAPGPYAAWLAALYQGGGHLTGVQPDRLGEALVSRFLAGQPRRGQDVLEALFRLPTDAQVARCLDVLARLAATDRGMHVPVRAALASCHDELRRRTRPSQSAPGQGDLVAGAYDRLIGSLGVVEQLEQVSERESDAATVVADRRDKELETTRLYTDSVEETTRLREEQDSRREELAEADAPRPRYALLAEDPAAAAERLAAAQRVQQLEADLAAARSAREDAEYQLRTLRDEREDLDNLVALKRDLEEQRLRQAEDLQREWRRREAEQEQRQAAADQLNDATRAQLEERLLTEFRRAQDESDRREKAERDAAAARRRIEILESQWMAERSLAREELDRRSQSDLALRDAETALTKSRRRVTAVQERLDAARAQVTALRTDLSAARAAGPDGAPVAAPAGRPRSWLLLAALSVVSTVVALVSLMANR